MDYIVNYTDRVLLSHCGATLTDRVICCKYSGRISVDRRVCEAIWW